MNVWHDLSPGVDPTEKFFCVIEIPAGSQNKYEIDKESGLLMLDRVLNASMLYPVNYGMVPQTLADDSDPLDVLLLATNPVPPMTIVEARPIGMLMMIDDGDFDQKIVAVPTHDPRFVGVTCLDDVPVGRKAEIEDFFRTYKSLEKKESQILKLDEQKFKTSDKDARLSYGVKGDKSPLVEGYLNLDRTKETIQDCLDAYIAKFGQK